MDLLDDPFRWGIYLTTIIDQPTAVPEKKKKGGGEKKKKQARAQGGLSPVDPIFWLHPLHVRSRWA